MKLSSRVKRLFLLAALVLTLVVSSAFLKSRETHSKTVCDRRYSTIVTYYSDATYTNEIGFRSTQCNGTVTSGGSTSPYQQTENIDSCCPNPGGPGCLDC
jgi:hypothetical protein